MQGQSGNLCDLSEASLLLLLLLFQITTCGFNRGFVSVRYSVLLWEFGLRYFISQISQNLFARVGVAACWIWSPSLVVPTQDATGLRDGCIWARGYGEFLQPKFECGCCEMLVFMVCGAGSNFYMFNLYRSPDLEFHIFHWFYQHQWLPCRLRMKGPLSCLLGDLNGLHQEWFGYTATA